MKEANHYFWMPWRFDLVRQDTNLLDDKEYRLYCDVLEMYWRAQCQLPTKTIAQKLRVKASDIDGLVAKVPRLSVQEGAIHHPEIEREFARAVRKSEGAKKAAAVRWGNDHG